MAGYLYRTCLQAAGIHVRRLEGYPELYGQYRISTLVRNRSVRSRCILRYDYKGTTPLYPCINLEGHSYYVHRLVAETPMDCYPSHKV